MVRGFARFVCVAAAAFAAPSPAPAQCRLCEAPTTVRDEAADGVGIELEIETSLDFDRLILLGIGNGTATLRPDGSRAVSGTVGDVSGRAMVGSAAIRGEPGRPVRIGLPSVIELHSLSGGRVTIEEVMSDLAPLPRLDGSGRLLFRFGGRLQISGDAEGDYRGEVPITVEYL